MMIYGQFFPSEGLKGSVFVLAESLDEILVRDSRWSALWADGSGDVDKT
jgi:hypothetical protein